MKKIIFLFSLLLLLATSLKAQTPIPNSNLTWEYDKPNKTIIIAGNGEMPYFTENIPWDTISSVIEMVEIKSNVTSIAEFAFNNFYNLTRVDIGESVNEINISWSCPRSYGKLLSS